MFSPPGASCGRGSVSPDHQHPAQLLAALRRGLLPEASLFRIRLRHGSSHGNIAPWSRVARRPRHESGRWSAAAAQDRLATHTLPRSAELAASLPMNGGPAGRTASDCSATDGSVLGEGGLLLLLLHGAGKPRERRRPILGCRAASSSSSSAADGGDAQGQDDAGPAEQQEPLF